MSQFCSIPDALLLFAQGEFLIVTDSADRENEGDLIISAQKITAAQMAFMIRHTSGIICAPMIDSRCELLSLPPMTAVNQDIHSTAFTVSCDAHPKHGIK